MGLFLGVLAFHLNKIDPPIVVVHTGAILQQDSIINTHTCTHRVSTHEVTCGINVTMHRLTSSHSLSKSCNFSSAQLCPPHLLLQEDLPCFCDGNLVG